MYNKLQNNIIKSAIFNINSICRGCLSDRNETLQSIHINSIQRLFTECTNLQITDCDGLPSKICSSCVYKCVSWQSFKRQCEYSENAIRNQLIHLRNDVPPQFTPSPTPLAHVVPTETLSECSKSSKKNIISFNRQQSSEMVNTDHYNHHRHKASVDKTPPMTYTVFKLLSTSPPKEQKLNSKISILENIQIHPINNNNSDPIVISDNDNNDEECDLKMDQELYNDAAQQIIDDLDDSNICTLTIDLDREIKNNEKMVGHNMNNEDEEQLIIKSHHMIKKTTDPAKDCINENDHTYPRHTSSSKIKNGKRKVKEKNKLLKNILYTCDICKTGTFRKRDRLEAHLRVHMGKKPEVCKLCNKEFNNLRAIKRHCLKHNDVKKYSCLECGKLYKYQTSLTLHKKFHLNIRSFVCDLCGKSFIRAHGLQSHLISHSTERSFECNLCGKKFKNNIMLRNHQVRHSGIKNFTCTYCDKPFTTSAELTTHNRTHTGIKPFPCSMCNKYYKTKSHLAVHFRTHTGVRPYACDLCPLAFAHNKVLKQHRLTHTGERPYICHVCNRSFRQKSTLNVHLGMHERQFQEARKVTTKISQKKKE